MLDLAFFYWHKQALTPTKQDLTRLEDKDNEFGIRKNANLHLVCGLNNSEALLLKCCQVMFFNCITRSLFNIKMMMSIYDIKVRRNHLILEFFFLFRDLFIAHKLLVEGHASKLNHLKFDVLRWRVELMTRVLIYFIVRLYKAMSGLN